jgi:hypothetical protein
MSRHYHKKRKYRNSGTELRGALPKDHALCENGKKGKQKIFSKERSVLLDLPANG